MSFIKMAHMMEQHLQYLLQNCVDQYGKKKFRNVVKIFSEANSLRHCNFVENPLFMHFDALFLLAAIEEKIEPMTVVTIYLQNYERYKGLFLKVLQRYENPISFTWSILRIGTQVCLMINIHIFNSLLGALEGQTGTFNQRDLQTEDQIIPLLQLWKFLIEVYFNNLHSIQRVYEQLNHPNLMVLVTHVIESNKVEEVSRCWFTRAQMDFYSINCLHLAYTAFEIVHKLESFLFRPEVMSTSYLHLQAIKLELFYDGDIEEFEACHNPSNLLSEYNEPTCKKWYERAKSAKTDPQLAKFLLKSCILICAKSQKDDLVKYHTDLAFIYLDENNKEAAIKEVKLACTFNPLYVEKETVLQWKELGTKFYVKREVSHALYMYQQALSCCSDLDTILKRDLNSNISLMLYNMKLYQEATVAAQQCIASDHRWYKGYFRLASAQYELAKYRDSLTATSNALALISGNNEEEVLALYFKNRSKLGLNEKDQNFPKLGHQVYQKTANKLYQENSVESWGAIDNLLFHSPDNVCKTFLQHVSLCKALPCKISTQLLARASKLGADVNEVFRDKNRDLFSPLKVALKMKQNHHAALLIRDGALLEPWSDGKNPPIIVAAKLTINEDYDVDVISELLSLLPPKGIYSTDLEVNNISHMACKGDPNSAKIAILKLLADRKFDFGRKNINGKTPMELLSARSRDPREMIVKKSTSNDLNRSAIFGNQTSPVIKKSAAINKEDEEIKVYTPSFDARDEGMRAFMNKDWKTAASEFNRKTRKMKRNHGQNKRDCEIYLYCAIADLKVGKDKSSQVFNNLRKAYTTNQGIMKSALPYACGEDYEDVLIGYVLNNCIKEFSKDDFETLNIGVMNLRKLVSSAKQQRLDFIETSVKVCKTGSGMDVLLQTMIKFDASFAKELCVTWFGYCKRMLEKRKCEQTCFLFVIRLAEQLKDPEIESSARLHVSLYNLAFESNKSKAADNFEKAALACKETPKLLCNEWLKKVSELKTKDRESAIFFIHMCTQLFLRRNFESEKFLVLMKDFAVCAERQTIIDKTHFKTFLTAVHGIQIYDQEVAEIMRNTGRKFSQKGSTVLAYQLALELVPNDSEELKVDLLVDLTKHYFELEQYDECIKFADKTIQVIPSNKDCYKWKAKSLLRKKESESCIEVLVDALKTFEKMDDKEAFMIELCDVNIEPDWSKIEVDSELLEKVVKKLLSLDDSKTWQVLEKLVLSFPDFNNMCTKVEIPLLRALSFSIKESFANKLVERLHWKKVEKECLVKLARKCFFDTITTFVLKKGKDKSIKESPIVIATQLVVNDGCKLELINRVIGKLFEEEFQNTVNYAIQECCCGDFKESKKDVLEILFIKANNMRFSHDYRKHLKANDPRFLLFDQYKHGHIDDSKLHKDVKKKKDPNEDECIVRLDVFKNVDNEVIIQAINSLQSQSFCVLTNKNAAEILEKSTKKKTTAASDCTEEKEEKEQIECSSKEPMLEMDEEKLEIDETEGEDVEMNLDAITFEDTWEVECTQEVYRVLRSRKVPMQMKKKILGKIKQLASGEWPRDIQKRLEGVKEGITLYEAKINKASRIIWEISVSFSERRSMEQNISDLLDRGEKSAIYEDKIRIWNIALQHDDVSKMIEKIEHSHDRGEDCILRKRLKGMKQKPTKFNHQKHPNVYMNEDYAKELVSKAIEKQQNVDRRNFLFVPAASPNKEEYNILKFYSFTSQVASRILSVSNSNYDFPFQVSPLEYAVIKLEPKHKCAILLLGRSGTGKTTCCLYRLWSQYLNYWKSASLSGPQLPKFTPADPEEEVEEEPTPTNTEPPPKPECSKIPDQKPDDVSEQDEIKMIEDCEHLRQILITKNEVLCNEIQKNFKELTMGTQVTHYEELDEIDSKSIQEIEPENYPLFVTTKDLLLLLDNSLDGEKFFERDEDGNMKFDIPGWGKNKLRLSFLPSMSEEYDDDDDDDDDEDEDDQEGGVGDSKKELVKKKVEQKVLKKREVTYEVFANEIWPKLIKKKTKKEKNCHPSLVWMEIKSFIKGSAEAFVSKDKEDRLIGYLSKEDYMRLGKKRAPNFEGNREEIYDIFLRYLKLTSTSIYFDEMDLHFQLYKRLKKSIIPEWAFHQIYLDETQDFTQSEILLFIRCSANPNAMFFTGDTAQSIMSGVAFRFCDLKSLYVVAKQEFESLKLTSPITVPSVVHQLTHNYRSHSGILKLSSTVVKLLELLFPTSIEINAKPDIGLFPGPSPVILETDDFSELAILLQGSKRQTSAIEFGAHQVVLVQNEACKEKLPAELSYGLVLSIYEAKGLEFDDVLLYNFFKDSPAYDEWRVVASNVDNVTVDIDTSKCSLQKIPQKDLEYNYRPLDFDYSKHKLLNSELKKLYTAVTRARVNVWIFDEDKKKRAPMFDFLVKKKLVDVAKLEDGNVREYFVEQSSKEQWAKQGSYFFGKGLWKLAMKCAQKAESASLVQKCKAKLQFELAYEAANEWEERKGKRSLNSVMNGFKICALSFLNCGLIKDAEISLRNSRSHDLLAVLYEREGKFTEAAKEYKVVGSKEDALRCYTNAGNHRAVMSLLKSTRKYVEALHYQKKNNLTEVDKIELIDKALEYYEGINDCNSIQNVLNYAKYSHQVTYLRSRQELHYMLEDLYKRHNKYDDLARYYIEKKKFVKAAKIADSLEVKVDHLIKASQEYAVNRLQMVGEELKQLFQNVIKSVKEIGNPLRIAEAYYWFTYLTTQQTYIVDAIKLFDFQIDHLGKLICFKLIIKQDLVNKSQNFLIIDRPYKRLEELVKAVLRLIEDMYDETSNIDKPLVNNCLTSIGYHLNGKTYEVGNKSSFNFYHKVANIEHGSDHLNRRQITKPQAKATAAKILTLCLKDLVGDFRSLVSKQVHLNSVCQMVKECSNSQCKRLHQPPAIHHLNQALRALFSEVTISGHCSNSKRELTKIKTIFSTFRWMDLEPKSLHSLHELLQSYKPYLHLITSDAFFEIFDKLHQFPRENLKTLMRVQWNEDVNMKKLNLDSYVGLSYLSYIVQHDSPIIDELRMSKKERYYPFNLFDMHNESLELLYYNRNIRMFFYKTFSLLRKSPKVNAGTLCDIFEVPLVFLFAAISATSAEGRPFPFMVPNSYIQQYQLWDTLFGQDGFKNALCRLQKRKYQWENFADILKQFCEYLSNPDGFIKELMKIGEFVETNPFYATQLSRLICLYLFVLVNLQDGLGEYGRGIAVLFKNTPKIERPGALCETFNKLQSMKNRDGAITIFKSFLKSRDDSIQQCEWSVKNARIVKPGTIKPEKPKRILKREILEEDHGFPTINESMGVEDYDKIDEEEKQAFEKEDKQFKEKRALKQRQARQSAIERVYYEKWLSFVERNIKKRKCYQKFIEYLARLRIQAWLSRCLQSKCSNESNQVGEDFEDLFSTKYFKFNKCVACNIEDCKTVEHVKSPEHGSNVKLFDDYSKMKEDYDQAYESFIDLDLQDATMDTLCHRYTMQSNLLILQNILYPFTAELRHIVTSIMGRCRVLASEQERKREEEESQFEKGEHQKRKNWKKNVGKR